MIFSPLIDQLAALPLTMLVRPAEEQYDNDQTACYCPFCKGSTTPHFIIYKKQKGGLYGKPVEKWMCTKTYRSGYGAVELLAAINGMTLEGENLRRVCIDLARRAGLDFPELHSYDYKVQAERPQQILTFTPRADFMPQELNALGCTVGTGADGVIRYGFGTWNTTQPWQFTPDMINKDFRIYSLHDVTLPAVSRGGEEVSERIIGTPFNPLFICFADDGQQTGCIFRPAMSRQPVVFSLTDEHTTGKVSRWLGGDKVFTFARDHADSESTAVFRAIREYAPSETFRKEKEVWVEEGGKATLEKVPVPDAEVKADNIIYCASVQDAVAAYYHLNALRHTYSVSERLKERYYHVAFTFGGVEFSTVHYRKLARFAYRVYTLFPNDAYSLKQSRVIGRRFRDIYRAELPATFKQSAYRLTSRLYARPVSTVRDFFMSYSMTKEQSFQYDGDINKLFLTALGSALTTSPFERKEKRDKNGQVKEEYYVIDPATLWEFMAGEGYVRDVNPDSPDKIGRFVHLDGPFVDELDARSMLAKTSECLIEYARQVARPGTDDYRLMKQAVARAKEISDKTVVGIPPMQVDYQGGYGPALDHFFYENGALRITPDEISFVPYSNINFNVDRGEVLKWRFGMPFLGSNVPFRIEENPEYKTRLEKIEAHRAQLDDNGRPMYTLQQIAQERSDLMQWGRTHRWVVDFFGKQEKDLWPALRVLRGFANKHWDTEEELIRDGQSFAPEEQAELNGHLANLLFCLGRMLWRYRESKSNCIPYLMENTVENERKASGGSGKSSFIKTFAACAGYVLNIDGKNIVPGRDFSLSLSEYRHHHHRIVHWEDWSNRSSMEQLYNYATSGFAFSRKFENQITIGLSEAPGHVITSNYPPSNTDDSTMRRICIGGFSHRFCGENPLQNKAARFITDIMPDFSASSPDSLKSSTRNQIAYICALAVQFVMKYDERVDAPQEDLKYRALVRTLGESFVRWAAHFFEQDWVYGTPVDLDSAMQEYVTEYSDASDSKADKFSRKAFYQRVCDYCQTISVLCNPPHLYKKGSKAQQRRYFALQAWCTQQYFMGKDWEGDTSVQPKTIRELKRSEYVVFFYRPTDKIPDGYDSLMQAYNTFIQKGVDPAPVLDEKGEPVTLTEDERQRWRSYKDRRQGKSTYTAPPVSSTAPAQPSVPSPEENDLPF